MNPILVASPNSVHFLPPICFDELYAALMSGLYRAFTTTAVVWALIGFLALVMFHLRPSLPLIGFAIIGSVAAAMNACDYVCYLQRREWLTERALFFYWLRHTRPAKVGLAFWLCFAFTIGGVQLFLQDKAGGLDPLVREYGTLYSAVRQGELWRLVVGPLFHSSVAHFANNVAFLCFIGPLTWAVFGPRSFLAFSSGATVGAAIETIWQTAGRDAYVGVSGGVFALLGLLVASGMLDKKSLPRGFALYCGWLTGLALALAELFSPKAATVAHFSGLFVGVMFAAWWYFFTDRTGRDRIESNTDVSVEP